MSRWGTVWRLLRGQWDGDGDTDVDEAKHRHERERHRLAEAIAQRQVVENAASQIRRAQQEHDFTALVEETFMIGRR